MPDTHLFVKQQAFIKHTLERSLIRPNWTCPYRRVFGVLLGTTSTSQSSSLMRFVWKTHIQVVIIGKGGKVNDVYA
jgi:hypothetical protein